MGKYLIIKKANTIISRNTKKAIKNKNDKKPKIVFNKIYKTRNYYKNEKKENEINIIINDIKNEFKNNRNEINKLKNENSKQETNILRMKLEIENMKIFKRSGDAFHKNELDKKDKKIDELKDQIEFLENMILFGLDLNN